MHVVAAIIQESGRFLLARRAPHRPDAGFWEFPGGKVSPEESPQAALARELHEELSVEALVGPLFLEWREDERFFQGYLAQILSGQPQLSDHDELRWLA